MTNQEALRMAHSKRKDSAGEERDFLNTIINVLEQDTCEDAISRQAVMDALCDGCELFKNGEQTCFTKCEEYHFLATLPPVNPQPKTDVLDKIGAEIDQKQYDFMSDGDYDEGIRFGLMLAYQIIDKYKAESEG